MSLYDVGEPVILTGLFYSDAAKTTLADPTTATLSIRDPAGVVTTPSVTHASTGTYTVSWTPLVRGMHEIHWAGAGALVAVEQYGINVRGGFPTTTDLVDVQSVRASLRMPKADGDQDALLEQMISDASAHLIDAYNREFAPAGSVATLRSFTYRGGGVLDLSPYNAQTGTITIVASDTFGTLASGSDWYPMPVYSADGVVDYLILPTLGYPTQSDNARIDVTAKWGYPSVPTAVQSACRLVVMDWYRRDGSRPSGFTTGDEDPTQSDVAIPQRARWIMRGYERTPLS